MQPVTSWERRGDAIKWHAWIEGLQIREGTSCDLAPSLLSPLSFPPRVLPLLQELSLLHETCLLHKAEGISTWVTASPLSLQTEDVLLLVILTSFAVSLAAFLDICFALLLGCWIDLT